MQRINIREIACGLEHVVAVVDIPTGKKAAQGRKMVEDMRILLSHLANGDFEEDVFGTAEMDAGRRGWTEQEDDVYNEKELMDIEEAAVEEQEEYSSGEWIRRRCSGAGLLALESLAFSWLVKFGMAVRALCDGGTNFVCDGGPSFV